MKCTHCGGVVEDERWELGYKYCKSIECSKACAIPLDLVSSAVNKAAYQIERRSIQQVETKSHYEIDPESMRVYVKRVPIKQKQGVPNPIFQRRDKVLARLELLETKYESGEIDIDRYLLEKSIVVTVWNNFVRSSNVRYRNWTLFEGSSFDTGTKQRHSLC